MKKESDLMVLDIHFSEDGKECVETKHYEALEEKLFKRQKEGTALRRRVYRLKEDNRILELTVRELTKLVKKYV